MAKNDVRMSITEVTIHTGKTKTFKLDIDGANVSIPVDDALFVNYQNQFYRPNPTPQQRVRFATLLNLMRAAYEQGKRDSLSTKK
jgi:hypothetical protein